MNMPPDLPRSFATTRWSLVAAAADKRSPDAGEALQQLCERYWVPLYAFAIRRGLTVEDAQDLTQEFFTYLLSDDFLTRAESCRGRFRSFMLTAFDRYATSQWRRQHAKKRGGHLRRMNLDFAGVGSLAAAQTSATPESAFQQQWAIALLSDVVEHLRSEYQRAGQMRLFECLEHHWNPTAEARPHGQIAEELGMPTPAVNVAAHRLRTRYRLILRKIVADTVDREEDIDDEIRDLMKAFEKSV